MFQIQLGNKILVYISCCLTGRAYPLGDIASGLAAKVQNDVLHCVMAEHMPNADLSEPQYPYMRTLVKFDSGAFFNVLALAFEESTMRLESKQKVVDVALCLMNESTEFTRAEVRYYLIIPIISSLL